MNGGIAANYCSHKTLSGCLPPICERLFLVMSMLTPSIIARESLMILKNNCVVGSLVYKGDTSNFTAQAVGDTVTIRKPAVFTVGSFTSSITTQTVNEASTSLTLDQHFDTSIELTSKQMTLELSDFSKQVIEPVMVAFAETIDSYLYSKYTQIYNVNGDGNLNTVADLADLDRALMVAKVPMSGRVGFLSPLTKSRFLSIDNLNRLDTRGDAGLAGLRDAMLGRVMNIDFYGAQSVPSHTAGVPGGTPLASGTAPTLTAPALSSTVTIAGGGASGTFKAGDILSFAGISGTYAVQADVTLNGSGVGSLTVTPALAGTIASAAVTVKASHAANIVGHPRGISFVCVPLELPHNTAGPAMAGSANWDGLSIRVVRGYDINSKKNIISFDSLVGAKVTDPRLLTRFDA